MAKILFIINGVSIGGAERVVSILANALVQNGYDVNILAFHNSDKSYNLDKKIKVIFSDKISSNFFFKRIDRIKMIRKAIKENDIDIVIAFSTHYILSSIVANFGMKKKIIGSERNDPAQVKNRLIVFLRNHLYPKLDCLVLQTEDAKNYFSKKIQSKSQIILNPLNAELPEPYIGVREKKIITFCRIEPQKNIKMLLDAFELFYNSNKDYELLIYGEGSEKEKMKEYAASLKSNNSIVFFPFTNNIYDIAKKCSLFVLTSNYEGLSNSMLEALALGIPTIVTDCPCGGAKMVINDGENGFLVPVGDYKKMAEMMEFVLSNDEIAKKVSKNSIKIRDELDQEKICTQWIKVIKGVEQD